MTLCISLFDVPCRNNGHFFIDRPPFLNFSGITGRLTLKLFLGQLYITNAQEI